MQRSDLSFDRYYRVTGNTGDFHNFAEGDVLQLARFDGTNEPDFVRLSDGFTQFVSIVDLEVID